MWLTSKYISPMILSFVQMRAVVRAATQRMSMAASSSNQAQAERHRKEQHLITIMLIVVVGVFLVCMLPQALLNLYKSAYGDSIPPSGYHRLLIAGNVCNL